jgi:DNA-binding ferritin-like protein
MLQRTSLTTPTDLSEKSVQDISGVLLLLLSDVFALYLKTKNFHWHMSGPHFRDYHLMLDDQSEQIFAMTDDIAERRGRSVAQACARSGRSRVSSASWTTMPNTSNHSTC